VAGHLDQSRLHTAFSQALSVHPMARARKVASRRSVRGDQWEIRPAADVDPLRVVDCPDDAALDATRVELQSMAVPLAESPPLRARLAHHPDGDVLMLNANHAAMDAFGVLRIVRSVARAYAGEPDPVPEVSTSQARSRLAELTRSDRRTRVRRCLALAEKLRDVVARPARVAPDGASGETGYGFHHIALPPELTGRLIRAEHPGTVNDLLLGALHLAIAGWNADHGATCRRIGVLVPANLRPGEWKEEVVGNFSLPARVSTSRRQRRHPGATLRALTAQTSRKKSVGMGTALLEVLRGAHLLPMWAKKGLVASIPVTGDRLVDTAMLSNLGPMDQPPSFGPGVGRAVEAWFSPPARMPLGLTVGAVTLGGRLHLSFRYRRRLFDDHAAGRFADRFVAELTQLVDGVTALAS
jgi:NRPS condensation-like uncharacterized protein